MRISDWSSDVCSSDLRNARRVWLQQRSRRSFKRKAKASNGRSPSTVSVARSSRQAVSRRWRSLVTISARVTRLISALRSEEHTSELQSLISNTYAVFCLNQKNTQASTKVHTSTKRNDNN